MINRRELLANGATLAAMAGLGTWPKLAFGAGDERFLVFIRLIGGWDITLSSDPWLREQRPDASDMFIEYRHDELLNEGDIYLGPAASPILKHARDITILNGVISSESDNGHPAALNYISTGNGQGKAPDFPVEINVASGKTPYGVLTTFSLYLADRKISYTRAFDILSSRGQPDPAESLEGAVKDPRTALERAIEGVIANKEITRSLREELDELAKTGELRDEHAIAAGFLSGASRQAQVDFYGGLDTHANHEGAHKVSLKGLFEKVEKVFDLFKSLPYGQASLFDHTTFVIASEFARTPALNGAKGKDHNPMTNSLIFAGAGIQKGKMINKSLLIEAARSATKASYHMASPFDFVTGLAAETREGANFIWPENVVHTIAKICRADMTKFRSVPAGTLEIPGLRA